MYADSVITDETAFQRTQISTRLEDSASLSDRKVYVAQQNAEDVKGRRRRYRPLASSPATLRVCHGGWPTLEQPPARCLRGWATAPGPLVPCQGCHGLAALRLPQAPRQHPPHLAAAKRLFAKANPAGLVAFLYQTLGVTGILSTQAVEIGCTVLAQPGTRVQKAPSAPAPGWQRPRKSCSVQVWRCLQSTHSAGWLPETCICMGSSRKKCFRKHYFRCFCVFSLVSDKCVITRKKYYLPGEKELITQLSHQ